LAMQTLTHAGGGENLDTLIFEHTRAHALLDVLAALGFENDRVDAPQMQELIEQEAGRAGADDGDLGTHGWQLRCRLVRPPCTGLKRTWTFRLPKCADCGLAESQRRPAAP